MNTLDRLEKRFRRFGVPNVTLYLVVLQGLSFVLTMLQPPKNDGVIERLMLVPEKVMHGEVWRSVSFLFMPPLSNPVFAFLALYFLYLMGTALEGYWGVFRYNLYLLIAWVATIGAAWITPDAPASNVYLDGSVFLAFAYLYPEFIIYLFFVFPTRIKWLALATWIMYGISLIFGPWSTRFQVLAAIANFLLFFGHRVFLSARYGMKHMSEQAGELAARNKPFHVCTVCGITDKTHRAMEFRYCPECAGSPGYCIDHIDDHEHRKAEAVKS